MANRKHTHKTGHKNAIDLSILSPRPRYSLDPPRQISFLKATSLIYCTVISHRGCWNSFLINWSLRIQSWLALIHSLHRTQRDLKIQIWSCHSPAEILYPLPVALGLNPESITLTRRLCIFQPGLNLQYFYMSLFFLVFSYMLTPVCLSENILSVTSRVKFSMAWRLH